MRQSKFIALTKKTGKGDNKKIRENKLKSTDKRGVLKGGEKRNPYGRT